MIKINSYFLFKKFLILNLITYNIVNNANDNCWPGWLILFNISTFSYHSNRMTYTRYARAVACEHTVYVITYLLLSEYLYARAHSMRQLFQLFLRNVKESNYCHHYLENAVSGGIGTIVVLTVVDLVFQCTNTLFYVE